MSKALRFIGLLIAFFFPAISPATAETQAQTLGKQCHAQFAVGKYLAAYVVCDKAVDAIYSTLDPRQAGEPIASEDWTRDTWEKVIAIVDLEVVQGEAAFSTGDSKLQNAGFNRLQLLYEVLDMLKENCRYADLEPRITALEANLDAYAAANFQSS